MTDVKDTNPKDAAAVDRAPIGLVPVPALVEECLAWAEGLLKYGAHNYTIKGIRASVYVFAAGRHIFKWWLGQRRDPLTNVHHLGSARACLGAIIDAETREKLIDDRPPSIQSDTVDALFDGASATLRKLTELYSDRKPRHYTIADTEPAPLYEVRRIDECVDCGLRSDEEPSVSAGWGTMLCNNCAFKHGTKWR